MERGRKTLTAIFTVIKDPALSLGEKTLWILYRSYDGTGNGAWISDKTAAEHLDRSVSSVQKYRAKLLKLGYLRQVLRGSRNALYHAVVPGEAAVETPAEANESRRPIDILSGGRKQTVSNLDSPYPSDVQGIADKVIEVGLGGVRPSNYAKQAARAKKLLEEHPLEYWLEAIEKMRGLYPYSEGTAFDVFTLGEKAHLALANKAHLAMAAQGDNDPYRNEW